MQVESLRANISNYYIEPVQSDSASHFEETSY